MWGKPWPSADRDKEMSLVVSHPPNPPSAQLLRLQMSLPFYVAGLAGDSEQSPLELAALSENTGKGEQAGARDKCPV